MTFTPTKTKPGSGDFKAGSVAPWRYGHTTYKSRDNYPVRVCLGSPGRNQGPGKCRNQHSDRCRDCFIDQQGRKTEYVAQLREGLQA